MSQNLADIHQALVHVPRLAGLQPDDYQVQRLGGLTNLVYRVALKNETLILRIPGEGTSDYIDRKVELHNAHAAAKAGISAQIIWADANSGVMISRCIEGIQTMTPALFQSHPGAAARAGQALARLHNSGQEFQFRFELFAMIEDYLAILSIKDIKLPAGYSDIAAAAGPVKQALAENPAPLAPCHCDPLCENFLDDGGRMWIVDWEYSGMNDPMWDLSDLSVEAGFDAARDLEMLTAYLGRAPGAAEHGRLVIYKAMCDLLWTLWGLIQFADGNTAEDFQAYALARFNRCRKLMQDPKFSGHLSAIENG
jgi:thiamine kinase-like enzyme